MFENFLTFEKFYSNNQEFMDGHGKGFAVHFFFFFFFFFLSFFTVSVLFCGCLAIVVLTI